LTEQRILGLDPGRRRIGVALSDPTGTIASPLTVIDATDPSRWDVLRELVAEYGVELIVVGLPVSLSGRDEAAAREARAFGAAVAEETGRRVELADERFTTSIAEDALIEGGVRRERRRQTVDKVAAAIMLQGYLDARRNDLDGEET